MFLIEPWYRKLTDNEIQRCNGDYIGCEICVNKNRCASLKLERLLQNTDIQRTSNEQCINKH